MGGPESICVVTPTHPWADSGVEPGPFVAQLIDNLVWTHGRVSVLLPNIPHGAPPFTLARERAKAAGVDLHCLFWPQGADQSSAYAVHRWLSKSRFTHALFVDSGGLGYWAISALAWARWARACCASWRTKASASSATVGSVMRPIACRVAETR